MTATNVVCGGARWFVKLGLSITMESAGPE